MPRPYTAQFTDTPPTKPDRYWLQAPDSDPIIAELFADGTWQMPDGQITLLVFLKEHGARFGPRVLPPDALPVLVAARSIVAQYLQTGTTPGSVASFRTLLPRLEEIAPQ